MSQWGEGDPVRSSVENPSGAFTPIFAQSDFVQRSRREQKQIQPKILTSAESFLLHRKTWDVEAELLMLRVSDSWITWRLRDASYVMFTVLFLIRSLHDQRARAPGRWLSHIRPCSDNVAAPPSVRLILMTVSFTTITEQVEEGSGASSPSLRAAYFKTTISL